MTREEAKQLLPLVNYPEWTALIKLYVDVELKGLHLLLETEKDHHRVISMQGEIKHLKSLLTLRDHVIARSKE